MILWSEKTIDHQDDKWIFLTFAKRKIPTEKSKRASKIQILYFQFIFNFFAELFLQQENLSRIFHSSVSNFAVLVPSTDTVSFITKKETNVLFALKINSSMKIINHSNCLPKTFFFTHFPDCLSQFLLLGFQSFLGICTTLVYVVPLLQQTQRS